MNATRNAGYLGAYDATSGNFVGAVARNLGGGGILTLEKSTNATNYLPIATFSDVCNDGGPVFIQILSPSDLNAGFVDLVAGVASCANAVFAGAVGPWAALVAADGFAQGQFPTPAPTRSTLQGAYGQLSTFCGESMVYALESQFGRPVLSPAWKDPNGRLWPSLAVAIDNTRNWLLATSDLNAYAAVSGSSVQQVVGVPRV
ncbi:hypothetical protein C8F01DRAFT_1378070 [Mycena amicta]|nr:hypothetical protein C8F01DRAFT_1378070 [Mycena amicta]